MEYATRICDEPCDDNFMRFVGYSQHMYGDKSCLQQYFSKNTIETISCKVTELLMGVDPNNRPIIVPDKTICSVMSAVYDNFRPETSDIYSRYNIPKKGIPSYTQRMIDEVINIITSDVKVNLGMDECNRKLTIWSSILGDFNEQGLRSHGPIKLREKRTQPMMFNMNY